MKHKIRRILPYLFVFAAFLIVSSYIQDRNDDLVFQESYAQAGSLIEWIRWFANNWGGRVIPQGLLAVLLQLPPIVFGLLNAAATTALAWLSRRIIDRDGMIPDGAYCFVFVLGLLFALPREILRGTVYWKCADVLYLWGFSTLFAALYPFVCLLRGKKPGIPAWIAAFFCAAYTASFEQLGICMTGMMVLLYAYHVFFRDGCESIGQNPAYRFGNVPTVVLLLAAAGLTVVFSLMPGNAVRLEEETVRWYPQVAMQSVPEKIIQGLAYTVNGLEQQIMPVLLVLAWFAMIIRIRRKGSVFDRILSMAVFAYFSIAALCVVSGMNGSEGWMEGFFTASKPELDFFGIESFAVFRDLLHYAAYLALGYLIVSAPGKRTDPVAFAFFFGGLGSLVLMGFSPTVQASAARPLFPGCLMMIMLVFREYCVWNENQNSQFCGVLA